MECDAYGQRWGNAATPATHRGACLGNRRDEALKPLEGLGEDEWGCREWARGKAVHLQWLHEVSSAVQECH
jgi:hypothetical protein